MYESAVSRADAIHRFRLKRLLSRVVLTLVTILNLPKQFTFVVAPKQILTDHQLLVIITVLFPCLQIYLCHTELIPILNTSMRRSQLARCPRSTPTITRTVWITRFLEPLTLYMGRRPLVGFRITAPMDQIVLGFREHRQLEVP